MSVDIDGGDDPSGFNLAGANVMMARLKNARLNQVEPSRIPDRKEPGISKRMNGLIPCSMMETATMEHVLGNTRLRAGGKQPVGDSTSEKGSVAAR